MPQKHAPKVSPPPRKRRTAAEARTAILDAAEQRLVAAGPGGIRLQEVAADVGVSHPTVLHHFGSREGLIEAVVARALDSLHTVVVTAIGVTPEHPDKVAALLESVYDAMIAGGHARALFWLALSGYGPTLDELRVRSVAELVHENRRVLWRTKKKRLPPFEDTYFTLLLSAMALLAMSVIGERRAGVAVDDDPGGPKRFRAWLARLIHAHLEGH